MKQCTSVTAILHEVHFQRLVLLVEDVEIALRDTHWHVRAFHRGESQLTLFVIEKCRGSGEIELSLTMDMTTVRFTGQRSLECPATFVKRVEEQGSQGSIDGLVLRTSCWRVSRLHPEKRDDRREPRRAKVNETPQWTGRHLPPRPKIKLRLTIDESLFSQRSNQEVSQMDPLSLVLLDFTSRSE